jgi:TRAP-type C4-dicarboxylate transport system substrate-binding protein
MISTFGRLAAAAVAAALLTATPSLAATTWRLSSMMTPESFEGQAYQRFADLVKTYSGGDLEIRIFPNEQIGSMDAVVEQLSTGVIQLAPSAVSFLSRWEKGITYAGAPFLFDNYDHWSAFMRGSLFQGWLDSVKGKAGIGVLGDIPSFPRGSYRTLVSDKPINTADDIKGLRVRQFQNQLVIDVWENLGAEVRVLPWTDVYDGISRGIVDAVTSPAELIPSMKFYEVAPHIVRTDEYPQAVAFMMNQAAYDALPQKDKDALQKAYAEAATFDRDTIAKQAETLVSSLKAEKGVTFNTAFDIAPLVANTAELYKKMDAAGKLPSGLLDAVAAARTAAKK